MQTITVIDTALAEHLVKAGPGSFRRLAAAENKNLLKITGLTWELIAGIQPEALELAVEEAQSLEEKKFFPSKGHFFFFFSFLIFSGLQTWDSLAVRAPHF